MEKISTTELKENQNYLLIEKNEGTSVKVLYIGCAIGQYKIEEDTFGFGNEYNIEYPDDNSIKSAHDYIEKYPCNGEIKEEEIKLYFFRSITSNIQDESEWAFNIVDSKNINIPSTTQNFKYYSYSEMKIINDEDIGCDWEKLNIEVIEKIFDVLVMMADEAEFWARSTPFGSHSITDAVKTGIFTSKISEVRDGKPIVNMNGFNIDSVKGWYDLANKLTGILRIEGQQYWCVYRAVKDIDIVLTDEIIQPLPFSSTYNLDWVLKEWIGENLCCLLKIKIPVNSPMVVIEPPDSRTYEGRKSQYEIALPAGVLRRESIKQNSNGLIISEYILNPWSYEECKSYLYTQ